MTPSITVVTGWYNHEELAKAYWMAMLAADAAVLVIDDCSDKWRPPNAVRMPANSGFARVNNLGLNLARTDAVLFLNNDIVLKEADWLRPIQEALEPGVLVGARLRTDGQMVDGQVLPYLDGWCLAGMRNDLLRIGGFDETFDEPSYFGDNDLCLRARACGMTLREASVPLHHIANVSYGHNERVTQATKANWDRYSARAREILNAG